MHTGSFDVLVTGYGPHPVPPLAPPTCNSPPLLPFQELLELNLVAEEWGGTTTIVPVSAKKGTGVADLLQVWRRREEEKNEGCVVRGGLGRAIRNMQIHISPHYPPLRWYAGWLRSRS